MSTFSQYASVRKLRALAAKPFDLTADGALTPKRIATMQAKGVGFKLLYGMQRVTPEVMGALKELADDAKVFEKMDAMQAGKVINRIEGHKSEERAVLHTAVRDFFDNPNAGKAAVEATRLAKVEYDELEVFMKKINSKGRFTDLITIGIGGSDLGPRALYLALQPFQEKGRRVHFISNVDPDDAAMVLANIDPKKCLVLVISKEGTTLETLTNEALVKAHFRKAGVEPKNHFVAITKKGSPLDDKTKYLAAFHIWDHIGGRYSALSMVGGVIFSFAFGFQNYTEMLRGANAMDKLAQTRDMSRNLPLLGALIGLWNRTFLDYSTLAVIPYSQALVRFTAHLQQCDMESNGKRIDTKGNPVDYHTGPVLWGEPGTNAQHSFFQLIHQGTSTVPVEFIAFCKSQGQKDLEVKGTSSQEKLLANVFAQSLALATGQKETNPNKQFLGNRPNSILLGDQLTPYSLGALLSYYENKVAFQGFCWGINSFDQEGVQLGKLLATKILDLMIAKKSGGKAPAFPLGQALLDQI